MHNKKLFKRVSFIMVFTFILAAMLNVGPTSFADYAQGTSKASSVPQVLSLHPEDGSRLVDEFRPEINAEIFYEDGIDLETLKVSLDDLDISSYAQLSSGENTTGSSIKLNLNYIPEEDLALGIHTVKIEALSSLGENSDVTWSFEIAESSNEDDGVENAKPQITDLTPSNESIVEETLKPTISAQFSCDDGIDMDSVSLFLDDIDVTENSDIQSLQNTENTTGSSITMGKVTYTPDGDLATGNHKVMVRVSSSKGVEAEKQWIFEIAESKEPSITKVFPEKDAKVGNDFRPLIGAEYINEAGIDSVQLYVDEINVTTASAITMGKIEYRPYNDLEKGEHIAKVEVSSANGAKATEEWKFYVGEEIYNIQYISDITKVQKDKFASVKIRVRNISEENRKASLILTLYDEKDTLINYVLVTQDIEAGKTVDLTGNIKVLQNGYVVNCMLWDSLAGMESLEDSIDIPVEQ